MTLTPEQLETLRKRIFRKRLPDRWRSWENLARLDAIYERITKQIFLTEVRSWTIQPEKN